MEILVSNTASVAMTLSQSRLNVSSPSTFEFCRSRLAARDDDAGDDAGDDIGDDTGDVFVISIIST